MIVSNYSGFVDDIDRFSGNRLKRKGDLLTLVSLGYSTDQIDLIEELGFTSKYVQGLFRILRLSASNPDVQNTDQIKGDITGNIEKIRGKIELLITNSDNATRDYFIENYLVLSQTGLLNLIELINDLEWTKKYLNYLKRKSSS